MVLNAANFQTGRVKYDLKTVDFRKIVEGVMEDKKGPVKVRGLELKAEIKEGDYEIRGDGFWLKEAAQSLMDNAIKYTLHGGLTVRLENKNDKVLFSVKDTGLGITDQDKKNLFKEGGRARTRLESIWTPPATASTRSK